MSKFKQVLKEWQNKIGEAAGNVMRIEDDQGQFTFPPDVSNRVPADIEDPRNPTFYAIGDVGFTITDDSDYDRETGYGHAMIFEIDYIDVESIEYTDKNDNFITIKAGDLTEGELKYVEDVLHSIATERYENGDINENTASFGDDAASRSKAAWNRKGEPKNDFEKYLDAIISTMSNEERFETESGRKVYARSWVDAVEQNWDGPVVDLDDLWDQATKLYKQRVSSEEAASRIVL